MTDRVSSRGSADTRAGTSPIVEPVKSADTRGVAGRTMLIAGATSATGLAAARALASAGARVVAVGHDPVKLDELAAALAPDHGDGAIMTAESDLTDAASVAALADLVHASVGAVDGILHLVGGWRGGGGLAAQTEADFRFLERSLTALRQVSRAFDEDLRASDAARTAIVSSTSVGRPLAGGANYAAVKAASEAWIRAVAQGFAKAAGDAGEPLRAAAVVFRVKALAGLEEALADAYVGLWDADAAAVNDSIVDLPRA